MDFQIVENIENTSNTDEFNFDFINFSYKDTVDLKNLIFDCEKTSPTIERELSEYNNQDKKQDKKEDKKTYSLNDVIGNDEIQKELDEEVEVEVLTEDDFEEMAELFIAGFEWVLVKGTNIYLKVNNYETLEGSEIEANSRQKKRLIKALSKVLLKYNIKLGVEMMLIITMLSIYGLNVGKAISNQKKKKKIPLNKKITTTNNLLKKETKKDIEKDNKKVSKNDKPKSLKDVLK